MYAILISKALRLARINEGSRNLPATHTFIHNCNEQYLPSLLSHRASSHFGLYSFPVPRRVGG